MASFPLVNARLRLLLLLPLIGLFSADGLLARASRGDRLGWSASSELAALPAALMVRADDAGRALTPGPTREGAPLAHARVGIWPAATSIAGIVNVAGGTPLGQTPEGDQRLLAFPYDATAPPARA